MSTSTSVFPFAHIALTTAITAGVALLVLVVLRTRFKAFSLVDCLLVAVVVGLSVMVWRSAGNTGALNNDPIPLVASPSMGNARCGKRNERLDAAFRALFERLSNKKKENLTHEMDYP